MLKSVNRISCLLMVSFAVISLACGGDGGTSPQNQLEPNLASIQANIFSKKCALSGCHVPGGAGPMPLRNEDESFANLVNVNSTEKPGLQRVTPNDPDNSYLVQKIEGASDIVGGQMPLGRSPLASSEINVIREWIADGALKGGPPTTNSNNDNGGY